MTDFEEALASVVRLLEDFSENISVFNCSNIIHILVGTFQFFKMM